jgi:hypothetical protein
MAPQAETKESPSAIIGCLLDVSGSMRAAFETNRPDEKAVDRLRAVLRAALQLAQTEQGRDPRARMFVGVFGLNQETRCPPVVDLCSLVTALLDIHDIERTGHELLIELANEHNLERITQYIRTKLSEDEARIVFLHLQKHPDQITEFVNAIPNAEELQRTRTQAREFTTGIASQIIPLGFGLLGSLVASTAAPLLGNKAVDVLEDHAADHSEALHLARRIWDNWWLDFATLTPRPVAEVVRLLRRLQDLPAVGQGDGGAQDVEGNGSNSRLDLLRRYMYGVTPLCDALTRSLTAFLSTPSDDDRVLLLISDGNSTDGDPLSCARDLQREKVTIATVYLTDDRTVPRRGLYDQPARNWNVGQTTLFELSTKIDGATHPIPVLASMGWQVPSSGECALYATACTTELLEEFCSLLLSARFGSTDALLDVLGQVDRDAYINDEHVRTCRKPSDQGDSGTCYAHATAAVIHMALARIVVREEGYPTIKEIRTRILERFPPISEKGQPTAQVLAEATLWYRPLRFRKVDEEGARQVVLRRRPVLTTFQLSDSGWEGFDLYFKTKDTAKSVLTRRHMASKRSGQGCDGHAVVLIRCAPAASPSSTLGVTTGVTMGASALRTTPCCSAIARRLQVLYTFTTYTGCRVT